MKKVLFISMMCLMALSVCTQLGCGKDDEANSEAYVDLGLPSGTLWKASNESGYYDYYSAIETFGIKLPTTEQFGELISYCTYSWDSERKGANFVSTVNGKSIFLPAAGFRYGDGSVFPGGFSGRYWSSTPSDSEQAYYLNFRENEELAIAKISRFFGLSVRLVYNP